MSAISKILDRLDGARQTAPGKWMARCPAHEDKSPSLSIKEKDDGVILLRDHGGCPTQDVLQAIGLDFGDLYDAPLAHHLPPIRARFSARELLELLDHEVTVAAMLVTDAEGRTLTPDECKRLRQASARIGLARSFTNGN